ncbi:MAG TPA: GspE/PulE family protein [Candidatus Paceibacterota bacterium]|nr:GspE/PulE family protein [Candidatus Paceibacterota bacterium]HPT40386.1 GspE/PulE family protein [Candidatus Paceibacterota bacterium]
MIPNKNLLDILIKNGKITPAIAESVLREAESLGHPVEAVLTDKRTISEEEIGKAKSEFHKIPLKIFNKDEKIPLEILNFIPEEFARNNKIVSFGKEGETLLVGMLNPDDVRAQEALRLVAKQKRINIGVYLVTASALNNLWQGYRSFEERVKEVSDVLDVFKKQNKSGYLLPQQRIVRIDEASGAIAEEAPVIKLVSTILQQAINARASDVHIEPQRTKLKVRFRVDGDLKSVLDLPLELHPPIVSRIKILSDLKIDETRVPQDGRFRTMIDNKEVDYRVSTFPTALGEKVAIRVLDPSAGLRNITDLGVNDYHLALLSEAMDKPFGMILVTGPTGSGKTTTLYAVLQKMNNEGINIVSLEDPVEYFVEGVNQSQVKPEIGYDFASGLRQIVRQDPDVIMVGEIRDDETAALAVHAALTGHIVLSTLHTNNAVGVVPRLMDMKVESFLLPSSLILMMAQRLVGRLCEKCKKKTVLSGSLLEAVEKELAILPSDIKERYNIKKPYEVYLPQGCEACNYKGIKGRIGIYEMLKMTPELEEAILKDPTETSLLAVAKKQGMISLRQDGIVKAMQGLVSLEEILKETR